MIPKHSTEALPSIPNPNDDTYYGEKACAHI